MAATPNVPTTGVWASAGPVFSPEPLAGLRIAPPADAGFARPIVAADDSGAPESAVSGMRVAGGSTFSGSSELRPMALSSAEFLSTDLDGVAVDYAAISLRRALRADHALLRQRGASDGGSALLNAAILLLSSEIVARQNPR